jgi:hypothetical protein
LEDEIIAARFMQAVGAYWRKRLVRILVAVSVLAGAVFLQYRLANIPMPVDVEKSTPKYTPVAAALIKDEELVLDRPSQPNPDDPSRDLPTQLLTDNGRDYISADVYLESARLLEDTSKMLRTDPDETEFPVEGLTQIAYATEGDKEATARIANQLQSQKAEPCRTSISVELADRAKMPDELRFFQLQGPGSEYRRYFEMKARGSDLVVRLRTSNRTGDDDAPGCGKTLVVGNWSRPLTGPVPINIVVPDGAKLRFSFAPFSEETKWSRPSDGFEPFFLQASRLSARAVRKTVSKDSSSPPPTFSAVSVSPEQPLKLQHLVVGADELRLEFSGQAMVQENGSPAVMFDLLQFARKYPLLAGILATLDAALLGWIGRAAFGSRQSKATKIPKGSKKKKRRLA